MGGTSSRFFSCVRSNAAGLDPCPTDDTQLGHSFRYVRSSTPPHSRSPSSAPEPAEPAFKSISGAAVSANSSTFGSGAPLGGFHGSASFSALPLQLFNSASGPLDSGALFHSGPLDGVELSAPLDPASAFSGPLSRRRRHRRRRPRLRMHRNNFDKDTRPWIVPLSAAGGAGGNGECGEQWAHGGAGEDRVHVVVSEEHRWLFVGIYDGFNGSEAPDFLVAHLYRAVQAELRGLFWESEIDVQGVLRGVVPLEQQQPYVAAPDSKQLWQLLDDADNADAELHFSGSGRFALSLSKIRSGIGSWRKDPAAGRRKAWFRRGSFASDDFKPKPVAVDGSGQQHRRTALPVADHDSILSALARALESTELAYLEMTDRAMDCNPELALVGSCLLVVLMRDDDVYVMNLGDSRAIVAQRVCRGDGGHWAIESPRAGAAPLGLRALQLSVDHSTAVEQEVLRIKQEHPDDHHCIVNDRVKGRLKVTRAFGAGYLKQPRWNIGLLEMFKNEFIGCAPYISAVPSLCHHKLSRHDKFLVLSSDGLYEYLSNENVVSHVENFIERFPDGDPAQSLIEELLLRAAQNAGMNFHELMDIPQGDRRKYHDDVTVMVISLEGRIWKSSGKCL